MEQLFLTVFHMSLTASILVIAVLALRLLFKNTPKALFCVLWGFVAIRLMFPISLESPFSLIPSGLTRSESTFSDITFTEAPTAFDTLPIADTTPVTEPSSVEDALFSTDASAPSEKVSAVTVAKPAGTNTLVSFFATCLWPLGILGLLSYAAISYLRIRGKVKEAVYHSDNVWLCDKVATPFILGIFRPRILLPSNILPEDAEHVIAHERAHLKRLDHIWKPLGFVLLSVYWFNPVLWIAYIFLCKDIELACDERVIRNMDKDAIKSYSSTLLSYSISRRTISFCPLAFGEVHVKKRIKNLLHYKRPAFWVMLLAVISCIAVAVCFLTNPTEKKTAETPVDRGKLLFLSFTLKDNGSDMPGYKITSEPYLFFAKENLSALCLPVHWTNNNYNCDFTYEEKFDVLRQENGAWVSCATREYQFPSITRTLPPKSSQSSTYAMDGFDFSESGLYRFRAELADGQSLWFDFEVDAVYDADADSLTDSALLSMVHAMTKDRTSITNIENDYPELYDLLLTNSTTTVNCFVNELSHAESYGLREFFMAEICSQLTGVGLEQGEYDPETWWATADQWLGIYKKHLAAQKYNDLAAEEGNQPAGTTAAWKDTALLSDTYHPKTPMPRPLAWVNYFYNPEKQPNGALILELPEFPGCTIYAVSHKIYADTPYGFRPLISGDTLWTTYVADLNEDTYPEICATVSDETAPEQLYIVISDIKNHRTYELRDASRYDYTLFGDQDSMFVKIIDRRGVVPDCIGELVLNNDTDTSSSLSIQETDKVFHNASHTMSSVQIDLLSYSNLYADFAKGESRWVSNDFRSICYFVTSTDWDIFTTAYPGVKVWKDHQVLSLRDAFHTEVIASIETYQDSEYYTSFFLSPHGLTLGATYRPHHLYLSPTQEASTDS